MAALVYQVIWARWLGLIFGNTTTSVSIILGAFMLGLALGSWLGGRAIRRLASPMRVYAYLELGIGIFAVAFPLLTHGLDSFYVALVSADSPVGVTLAWRAALAFALLLVPTTLMGATLPLLTEFFRRAPEHDRTWRVGLLYAANTIGAALGVIAASFVGIELVGIRATTLLAASLNFVVATIGFQLSRTAVATPGTSALRPAVAPPQLARTVLLVLTLSGALALASEVLWTRAFQILIGNSSYAFATILVVYLVGVAVGSGAFAWVVKRSPHLELWMVALLLGMGLWTLVSLESFGLLRAQVIAYSLKPISPLGLILTYLRVGVLLLPLALLSGALFPVATRLLEPDAEDAGGELVALAYSWNTLGSVLGSLLGGFVLAAWFDYFQSLYVLAGLYASAALGVGIALAVMRGAPLGHKALLVSALAVATFCAWQVGQESRFVTQLEELRPGSQVTFHRPGLQGVTTAIRRVGESESSTLLVNAQGMTIKITDTKMMAHLPMLVHPAPVDTLVICFGMGTTFRSAISHGGHVTVVELVPEVFAAFDQFYADAGRVRDYPEGRMVVNDGRNFLKLTRQRFDVITVDPPPPIDASGVTNLYSREFVALAREHLKPGGIFAHWLPFPGTNSGVESTTTFKMLMKTITEEFPYVMVTPSINGVGLHVLASMTPIQVDLDRIRARMAAPAVAADLDEWQPVSPGLFEKLEPWSALDILLPRPGRTLRLDTTGGLDDVPVLTDDRPRLEFDLWRTLRSGQVKHYPAVGGG
jgi:spermidine synthase